MKNIVLTGFMGTGKSVIGRQLAKDLGWELRDTDLMIEQKESMTIPEIFKEKGEVYFRRVERGVVKELACTENCVISTGGGAVMDLVNRKNLARNGLLIGLEASAEAILARTRGGTGRPILKQSQTKEEIKRLLKKRQRTFLLGLLNLLNHQFTRFGIGRTDLRLFRGLSDRLQIQSLCSSTNPANFSRMTYNGYLKLIEQGLGNPADGHSNRGLACAGLFKNISNIILGIFYGADQIGMSRPRPCNDTLLRRLSWLRGHNFLPVLPILVLNL